MTHAEEEARAALRASKNINQVQQALTDESRVLLAGMLRDEMRVAVAEGIAAAMTDENAERFWTKGVEVLRRQAAVQTGQFVLDGVGTLFKKLLWISIFVIAVYSLGGWGALKAAWKAFN